MLFRKLRRELFRPIKRGLARTFATRSDIEVRILAQTIDTEAAWYLAHNPDVMAAGIDAREHYLNFGAAEGRQWGVPAKNELAQQAAKRKGDAKARSLAAAAVEALDACCRPMGLMVWLSHLSGDCGQGGVAHGGALLVGGRCRVLRMANP